jgi:antitoxin MazE
MDLQVNRWGNSLAVRLPQELVRELGLHEDDKLHAEALGVGHLGLAVDDAQLQKRRAWLQSLRELHKTMPMTQPVTKDEMSRY